MSMRIQNRNSNQIGFSAVDFKDLRRAITFAEPIKSKVDYCGGSCASRDIGIHGAEAIGRQLGIGGHYRPAREGDLPLHGALTTVKYPFQDPMKFLAQTIKEVVKEGDEVVKVIVDGQYMHDLGKGVTQFRSGRAPLDVKNGIIENVDLQKPQVLQKHQGQIFVTCI